MKERDAEIFEYIKRYMKSTGFTPTYREIMAVFGLKSTSEVSISMGRLECASLIEWNDTRKQYKPVGAEWRFDGED